MVAASDHIPECVEEICRWNFAVASGHCQDVRDLHEIQVGCQEFVDPLPEIAQKLQRLRRVVFGNDLLNSDGRVNDQLHVLVLNFLS